MHPHRSMVRWDAARSFGFIRSASAQAQLCCTFILIATSAYCYCARASFDLNFKTQYVAKHRLHLPIVSVPFMRAEWPGNEQK